MVIYYFWRNSCRVCYNKLFINFTDDWQDGYLSVVCNVQFVFSFKYRQYFCSFERQRESYLGQRFIYSIREYRGQIRDIRFKNVIWDVIPSNAVAIFYIFNDFRYLENGCLTNTHGSCFTRCLGAVCADFRCKNSHKNRVAILNQTAHIFIQFSLKMFNFLRNLSVHERNLGWYYCTKLNFYPFCVVCFLKLLKFLLVIALLVHVFINFLV